MVLAHPLLRRIQGLEGVAGVLVELVALALELVAMVVQGVVVL
jgi:hypothetical protein